MKQIDQIRAVGVEFQLMPAFFVVLGLASMYLGCMHNWGDLKTASAGVIGAGIQAVTAQFRNHFEDQAKQADGG